MEPTASDARTDIIIVVYQGNANALGLSIAACGGNYRVLVIDNAGRIYKGFEWYESPRRIRLTMPENIGWVKGANVGLAMSTAPYVVLMNDDVEILTPGWLDILQSAFQQEPKLACVVPVVDDPRWPKQQKEGAGLRIVPVVPGQHAVSFFCVMFSREALVDIGYLDERFSPGYGDDDDWTSRAQLAGWKVGIHNDVLVKHQGAASFGKLDRGAIQRRNAAALAEKYGVKV